MRHMVHDIRTEFASLYKKQEFVIDKSGVKTIEILNANFVANDPLIFGAVNDEYVRKELNWYLDMSLNVYDIEGEPPQIWKQVADRNGVINSNYGWCIFSKENNDQFYHAVTELEDRPDSRRAVMIYTRPTMWGDHNFNGRSDFMCTNAVQYLIRENKVHAVVQMRSNDVVFGYRNDYAWQSFVLDAVIKELKRRGKPYDRGNIHWNVGSLHVYERHFYLVDHYIKTRNTHITKEEYDKLYAEATV